ncbi:telomere stability and silencing-domain-containing protein [Hysterangium stoloniferum]|nr:telomere stability and silencing-domain-containing protein [Hysterangium stoloniferum]
MTTTVSVSSFHPFPTVDLALSPDTTLSSIPSFLAERLPSFPASHDFYISLPSGPNPDIHSSLSDFNSTHVSIRITPRVLGGKGGFGSQLRAAGGRMSSQKTSNNDACRDLSGRRLSTVKEAKKLAEYLEGEPERKKAVSEARKAKIQALERQLGIDASETSSSAKNDKSAGSKRRFDDTEFLEQSREIVDSVKSAVAAGLLKKKKKAKTSHSPPAAASTSTSTTANAVADILEPALVAPAVAITATVVGTKA